MHIRKALQSGEPFDLLITDFSFVEDHREQELKGGEDLITAAKAVQEDIRIVVFSAEGRPAVIRSLYQDLGINAFVQKGRRDAEELSSAVETIVKGRTYMPLEIKKKIITITPLNSISWTLLLFRSFPKAPSRKISQHFSMPTVSHHPD